MQSTKGARLSATHLVLLHFFEVWLGRVHSDILVHGWLLQQRGELLIQNKIVARAPRQVFRFDLVANGVQHEA